MSETEEMVKEFLKHNDFSFDPKNNTWIKNDLIIPFQIAHDMFIMGESDKLLWLADNGFKLLMQNNELIITNGVLIKSMQNFALESIENINKTYKKELARILN